MTCLDVTQSRLLDALSGEGKEVLTRVGQGVQTGDQSNQYRCTSARAAWVEEGLSRAELPALSLLPPLCSWPTALPFGEVPSGIFPLPVWLLPVVIQEGFLKVPTWLFARGPSALCSLILVVPRDKGPLWAILPVPVPHVSPALDGLWLCHSHASGKAEGAVRVAGDSGVLATLASSPPRPWVEIGLV